MVLGRGCGEERGEEGRERESGGRRERDGWGRESEYFIKKKKFIVEPTNKISCQQMDEKTAGY